MDITDFLGRAWRNRIFEAWERGNQHLSASPDEEKLIELLKDHQEFAHFWKNPKKYLNYEFDPIFDEVDPFLHILIHEVVDEQITCDEPPGIRAVFGRLTEHNLDTHDVIHRIGFVFLNYISPVLQGLGEFDSEAYIEELQVMASDPNYFEQYEEVQDDFDTRMKDEETFLIPDMDHIMAEFNRMRRKEQDEKDITVNTTLQAALNKCPAMWVEAMGVKLKRPCFRKNRDRITDLCQYMSDLNNLQEVVGSLSDSEREALIFVLGNGGWVKHGQLARAFGEEKGDGWWWLDKPPTSTIGRLRLSALLFVGRAPVGTRRYKVAVVPKELREDLSVALNVKLRKP